MCLKDCMVVVGGRIGIPAEEPIPVTRDLMSKAVEILWWKPPPQQEKPTGKVQMLHSVMELYNNHHLSDVTLIVDGRHIPAHRHVLATHSCMFDRMWNHSMKEVCLPCLSAPVDCGRQQSEHTAANRAYASNVAQPLKHAPAIRAYTSNVVAQQTDHIRAMLHSP